MYWRRRLKFSVILSVLGLALTLSLLIVIVSRAATESSQTLPPDPNEKAHHRDSTPQALQSTPEGKMQPRDLKPPERPPDLTLSLREDVCQTPDVRQPGILIYRHWAGEGGEVETCESQPPISWPEPLKAKSMDKAILDLGTDVMPLTVEVRVYEKLGLDDIPEGEPAEVLICESDRLGGESCAMPIRRNQADGNLSMVLPTHAWEQGEHFLAIWAAWPVPLSGAALEEADQTLMYDASWILSLEVTQ